MKISKLFGGLALGLAIAMSAASSYAAQMSFDSQDGGDSTSAFGVFRMANGTPINVTGFTGQLWGSTQNNPGVFELIATTSFTAASAAPQLYAGRVFEGTVTVPAAFGATLFYQMRIWNNAGNTVTSFAQAQTAGVEFGASQVVSATMQANAIATPPNISNIPSFSLQAVPEPSVLALGLVGGLVLFMRRRK